MAVELKLTISDGTAGFTPVRVIAGREEISALYEYDILVRTTKPCSEVRDCLEKRVQLEIVGACIQKVHGIVMAIESTRQYVDAADISSAVSGEAWYKWTIRPAFAKACYSLNRLVYDEEKLSSGGKTAGEQLLDMLGQRWECPMQIETKAKAILATKKFIQFLQNDESDYNFFCRLLAHWGLGYMWKMADAKEELHVIDVSGSMDDVSNTAGEKVLIEPVSSKASMWTVRYGCSSVSHAVQNYNADLPKAVDVKINLHDMEAAQFLSEHGDKHTCHGKYVDQKVVVGQKAGWRTSDCQLDSALEYCITKASIATKTYIDNAGKKAQRLEGTVAGREWPASDRGIGIVPRPVAVNERPDISDEALIRMEEPGRVRSRTFMAIVVDVSECKHAEAKDRNLCKVREISPWGTGANIQLKNTLWVEMGSPFADANSGLLARPRVGNVLFCLDRGDMSIPIVLTSLFRDGNQPPVALLSGTRDTTAVTLRNRSFTGEKSSAVADMTPYSVPRSVHSLCTDKPLCSQIQLIGKDNGSTPNSITTSLSQDIVKAAHPEFGLGIAMGTNTVRGMFNIKGKHKTADDQIALGTRPHFQGINMYSEKDVLLQSSDSQFVNAGGTINITAAAGITLRVGRNSIVISEKGIELVNGCGHVDNPGASGVFPGDSKEKIDFAGGASHNAAWNNAIVLDQSGVGIQGTCIKSSAVNNVRMEVSQGGLVELNNYEATITAPHTKIIGGAALLNTLTYGLAGVCNAGMKGDSKIDDGAMGLDYVGMGAGGLSTIISEAVNGGVKGLGSGLFHSILSKYLNCISVTGSMVDLAPYEMTLSSQKTYNESVEHHLYTFAASGLRALGESSIGGFLTCGITDAASITNDKWYFFGNKAHRAIQGEDADFQKKGITVTKNGTWIKSAGVGIQAEATILETKATNITTGDTIVDSQSQLLTQDVRVGGNVEQNLQNNTVAAVNEMHATIGQGIGTRINA